MTKAQKLAKKNKSAFARGLETAEWIVLCCGLCIPALAVYKKVSTNIETQATTAVDKLVAQ
jgi:hypothetical protein